MSFIRAKIIKGRAYYYLVKSVREGKTVKQVILQYFGTTPPGDYVAPTPTASNDLVPKADVHKVSTTLAIEAQGIDKALYPKQLPLKMP